MKNFKHYIAGLSALAITTLISTQSAHASIASIEPTDAGDISFNDFLSFLVNTGLNVLFAFAAIAATLYIIWAGIQYITSNGDTKKTDGARTAIINGVIGLVIVVSAFFIVRFALSAGSWLTGGANDNRPGEIIIE
jgi:TRAP-type C4-dicarboxylate transport system permease small subunit